MKKYYCLLFLFTILLAACEPKPALFKLQTTDFGKNAVIGIYGADNGEIYSVQNITNTKQNFKINIPNKGYAAIRVNDGQKESQFWMYLEDGEFTFHLNGNQIQVYPVRTTTNKKEQEFIDFYNIKNGMSTGLTDSLAKAKLEMDKATTETIALKAQNLDIWQEKKAVLDLEIIRAFSKKFPNSEHTIFLLDKLGRTDSDPNIYRSIFNNLNEDIRESKAGKKLLEQINQSGQMMAGSKMPEIQGQNQSGEKFNPKILKKVNLIICWTSYSWKSRTNNKILTALYKTYQEKGLNVEFIGVSLDKKRDWWLNVIKEDQLIWPQFSDLKGEKSPNAKNLSNYNITYFFLVDKQGNLLSNNDLNIDFVDDEIKKNLKYIK
ncbi:thioredoxin family protein [Pedobacter nototheniae]|uniref:TlpA family protein disulfide reductase n=1 Tax=Pedobacter nototheniae TaxID=2488994 RepID=UPI0029301CBB|nr:thioredoxin family protein [Pedobacter nototheniae]